MSRHKFRTRRAEATTIADGMGIGGWLCALLRMPLGRPVLLAPFPAGAPWSKRVARHMPLCTTQGVRVAAFAVVACIGPAGSAAESLIAVATVGSTAAPALPSNETPRPYAMVTMAARAELGAAAKPVEKATSSAMALAVPAAAAAAVAGGRHADPELEALLPTTLGGVSLTVESQAGTDLATQSAAFDAFLAGLGKSRADFSLASAYSPGELKAAVGAWRVKGADPRLLMPGFKTAVQASSTTPLAQVEEVVAGRAVTRIGNPGQLTQGPLYVFVRGDTLLFVQTTERALAEEAVAKLPE